jgi:hypothetical protein
VICWASSVLSDLDDPWVRGGNPGVVLKGLLPSAGALNEHLGASGGVFVIQAAGRREGSGDLSSPGSSGHDLDNGLLIRLTSLLRDMDEPISTWCLSPGLGRGMIPRLFPHTPERTWRASSHSPAPAGAGDRQPCPARLPGHDGSSPCPSTARITSAWRGDPSTPGGCPGGPRLRGRAPKGALPLTGEPAPVRRPPPSPRARTVNGEIDRALQAFRPRWQCYSQVTVSQGWRRQER